MTIDGVERTGLVDDRPAASSSINPIPQNLGYVRSDPSLSTGWSTRSASA